MKQLNNNTITPEMKRAFRPLKKHLNSLTKQKQYECGLPAQSPTHKVVMRVSDYDDIFEKNPRLTEDPSREQELAMVLNPTILVSFTPYHDRRPDVFTRNLLEDFIADLTDNGFVPDDMQVFVSPHSTEGASLTLVVVFDRDAYGGEHGPAVDARFTLPEDIEPAPRAKHPLDLV